MTPTPARSVETCAPAVAAPEQADALLSKMWQPRRLARSSTNRGLKISARTRSSYCTGCCCPCCRGFSRPPRHFSSFLLVLLFLALLLVLLLALLLALLLVLMLGRLVVLFLLVLFLLVLFLLVLLRPAA